MTTLEILAPPPATTPGVNDLALAISTVNGTGSSSANNLLMRAIFRMGVPVSGKNLFPSNIQGLPTRYEIRVSGRGHSARALHPDLMVAMNTHTRDQDIRDVNPGGHVLWDSSWPLEEPVPRPDVAYLGMPIAQMCADEFSNPRERILLQNLVYAGAVAALLDIDLGVMTTLIEERYRGRPRLRDSNRRALLLGHEHALSHFDCPLPRHVAPMQATSGSIIVDGNTAAGLGCVYAGAVVAAWYPITPSTSLMDAFTSFCRRYRHDPAGGGDRVQILQAEDELAAMGMVIGAGWAGARAFTATSGPGLSLMNEMLGLAYYAEVPVVLFDVQRAGPSTGMPTRTQQADILEAAYASHGDTKHIVLFPGDPGECFDFAVRAFDLAERFQTPVLVLSDVDLGMNDWVVPRLRWDDSYTPDRGRVLGAAELEAMTDYHRYADPDADGVTARTLPGVSSRGAYYARGSGHNRLGGYTEDAEEYRELVDRLSRKHAAAACRVPPPVLGSVPAARHGQLVGRGAPSADRGPRIGLITAGSGGPAVTEAAEILGGLGIDADWMRIRGFPFGAAVSDFIAGHETGFVVEQNRDGQLRSLLLLETATAPQRLGSVRIYGGLPPSADEVATSVLRQLGASTRGR
jgi:2-oxoglutarate ferredoxin oxidoreductase subunit alpha